MSEIFSGRDGRGGGRGAVPGPAGTDKQKTSGHGTTHYIEFDNESGAMEITLLPEFRQYKTELFTDLHQEYFLANPDEASVADISSFIDNWLADKAPSGRR